MTAQHAGTWFGPDGVGDLRIADADGSNVERLIDGPINVESLVT